jgi:hypothetical protein
MRTLAVLYGILPELDLPAEEIDAVRYRLKWEGHERDTAIQASRLIPVVW